MENATLSTYTYTIPELDIEQDFESFSSPSEVSWLLREAAEDFHDHDGWDSTWPLKFHVFRAGTFLGCAMVEREVCPSFYVQKISTDYL